MHRPRPKLSSTCIDPNTHEWLPDGFDACITELEHLASLAQKQNALLLYRGQANRAWRLDSTFVREVKRRVFQMDPTDGFSKRLLDSGDLNATLTSLLLLKFGGLVQPSWELLRVEADHGVDAWFELMKRYQQYPGEDHPQFAGTNLLDWSLSLDVSLYFANDQRKGEGAVYVCNATATGKTLQTISVAEILERLRAQQHPGQGNGVPLLFCPNRQIAYNRAKNQQARYFAQMELRRDLAEQWRLQEAGSPDSTILVKVVLPSGSTEACNAYLAGRGITAAYIYPDAAL
jgi:hypothetical protein